MIILSNTLVLSAAEDAFPDGTPWIGYHNLVTTTNVTSNFDQETFGPLTNLANPATHLKWFSQATLLDEYLTIVTNYNDEIDYVGIAVHNFGSAQIPISVEGATGDNITDATSLLHFETGDSPTAFVDSLITPHVWLPVGNATVSGADFKFGSASGLFDGTGDYLTGDGSSDFAFGTGDFTVDFWIKFAVLGTQVNIFDTAPNGGAGTNFVIYKNAANTIRLFSVLDVITGATVVVVNQWHHIALTRASGITRLFLDGAQQGSNFADANNYGIGANRPTLGASGAAIGSFALNGRIDELRIIKGTSAYTTGNSPDAFSVETTAYSSWTEIVQETIPANDQPIIVRFTPQVLTQLRIRLQLDGTAPQAAVIYVGKLLVLERSITIGRGHVPVPYGRRTMIVNGMSEAGDFLGRIVLGEYRQTKAEFEWFNADYYRSDIDAFLEAAQETPFFWAWSPEEYPTEVGYCWLTNNAEPEVDPVTRRIALTLEMRGVA